MTLPLDPIYYNDVAIADRTRAQQLAQLGNERTQTSYQYGYTPTYDENGLVKALAMDPNNPNAKAALLKRSYDQRLRGNTHSFAQARQLYSGAYGVAQSLADQDYGRSSNNLQQAFINFIARNQGNINATNTNYTNALAQAASGNLSRAEARDTGANAPAPAAPAAAPQGNVSGVKGGSLSVSPLTGSGTWTDSKGVGHKAKYDRGQYWYLTTSGKWAPVP